jgi:hypothetical protein
LPARTAATGQTDELRRAHRRSAALSPWPNLARRPTMRAARARTQSDLQFVTRRLDPTARRTPPASGRAEHRSPTARASISRHEVIAHCTITVLWRRESRSDGAHRARSVRPTRRLTRRGSTEEPWHARQVFERHLPGRSRRWCFTARRQSVGGRAGVYPMCTRAPILDLDENYHGATGQ